MPKYVLNVYDHRTCRNIRHEFVSELRLIMHLRFYHETYATDRYTLNLVCLQVPKE
jgi:hypothetical protein